MCLVERLSKYNKKMDSMYFTLSEGDATRLENIVLCIEEKKLENSRLRSLARFLSHIAKPIARQLIDHESKQLDYRKFIHLVEVIFRFTPLRFNVGYQYIKGADYLCKLEGFGGEDIIDFALLFPQTRLIEPEEMCDYYKATTEKLKYLVDELRRKDTNVLK